MTSNNFSKFQKSSPFATYCKCFHAGFSLDVEDFLEAFKKENTFNYVSFANIWQVKNFTFIYADQRNTKILKTTCEIIFRTVVKYVTADTDLMVQVGAFYLLYGVFYKQPIYNKFKIRLTLEQYRIIRSMLNQMSLKGQYDILYIYAKMKSDGAFEFVAYPNPLDMSSKDYSYLEQPIENRVNKPTSVISKCQDLLTNQEFKSIEKTFSDYNTKMAQYAEQNPMLVPFKSTLMGDFKDMYHKLFNIEVTEVSKSGKPEEPEPSAKEKVRLKAVSIHNAQYRGEKSTITAIDLENDSNEKQKLKKRVRK